MLKLWDKMHNKDWQLSNRKHTAWQKEGKMYDLLRNVILPASDDLSRDFLLLSGAGDPVPKVAKWPLRNKSYHSSKAGCVLGTLVLPWGRCYNEWHFTDEATESPRDGVISQVKLCLRTPVPEPVLLPEVPCSLSLNLYNSSVNKPSLFLTHTCKCIEDEECSQL